MTCTSTILRTLCVTAFASVALSASLPTIAQANDAASAGLPAGAVAVVNGVAIPQARLDDAVKASRQPDTPQLRQALRQQLITLELFRQGAEKAHYDTKPEVVQAMSAAKINAETQLYLRDNIHPETATDAQVKARYNAIVAALGKEEYKPRVITVADDATANKVLAQLKSGTAFDALARQYSVAPNKADGGALPWVSFRTPLTEGNTQGLPLAVAQAITHLPSGAVTPEPIPAGNARVIVKLDAKRPTQVPTFDQAKDTIRQQLQALALEKAAAQFSASLLKDATIQQ